MAKASKLERANPEWLDHAIWRVLADMYDANERPGAEKWQADTRRWRPILVARIADYWSLLSGCDDMFPWHEDYVVDLFVSYRKAQNPAKIAAWTKFGIELPRFLPVEPDERVVPT